MNPEQTTVRESSESHEQGEFYHAMMQDVREGTPGSKQQWMEQHPERGQEIEILFDLPEYVRTQKNIAEKVDMNARERRAAFQSLTEWHFLTTNELIRNAEHPDEMKAFWNHLFSLSRMVEDGPAYLARAKTGIAAQAATYHILDRLGLHPKLSRPADDAFHAEDLTGFSPDDEKTLSVQTKTKKAFDAVRVIKQEHVSYPSVATKRHRVSSAALEHLPHFRGNLADLQKRLEQSVVSYRVELPRDSYDMNTGAPTEQCIEDVRLQFEQTHL